MEFWGFFMRLFGKKNRFTLNEADYTDAALDYAANETSVRELALNSAAGLIAGAVSRCEFKTYVGGKEIKSDEYYMWNVRPNVNESAAQFIRKWIYKLCFDGECLIIFENGQALVADTFAVKNDKALYSNTYTGVSANGFTFSRDFSGDEVLHYSMGTNVRHLIDMFYGSYKKAIGFSLRAFTRSRGERGTLETKSLPAKMELDEYMSKLQNDMLAPYFAADNAVLPLFEGQSYERTNASGRGEIADAADTRKLINDVFDMTALAFGIPPALLRGEMANTTQPLTNFLTFCIGPLCRMLADEINAKRYRQERYLAGDRLEIDTSGVKHVDLLDAATAVDKLISSGTVSINELREAIGKPDVAQPWGNDHFITKNYTLVDTLGVAAPTSGGEVKQE